MSKIEYIIVGIIAIIIGIGGMYVCANEVISGIIVLVNPDYNPISGCPDGKMECNNDEKLICFHNKMFVCFMLNITAMIVETIALLLLYGIAFLIIFVVSRYCCACDDVCGSQEEEYFAKNEIGKIINDPQE